MHLQEARLALERLLAEADSDDEQSVTIGFVDGAEVCLMGWRDRPVKDITAAEAHANGADCMQIVLAGGMQIYYPAEQQIVNLQAGDCHVVPAGKVHACVSSQRSVVLVIVGHRASEAAATIES